MWKQYKKELLAGGIILSLLSFALGCVFNASMGRAGMYAGNKIEQKADGNMPGNQPGPGMDGQGNNGQFGGRHHRGMGPGGNGSCPPNQQSPGNNNQTTPGNGQQNNQAQPQQPDNSTENNNNTQNNSNTTENNNTQNNNNTTQNKNSTESAS